MNTNLALKLAKIVHDQCDNVPHDIGMTLAQAVADHEKSENECDHQGESITHYDHIECKDCGSIRTDSGWGIASRKWFKSTAQARFYQSHGRLPE